MDWIIDRINEGFVDVVNPFNRKQVSRVSLSPNDVKCFVWWSKDFDQWIKAYNTNRDLFNSFRGHTFQFTINSPSELEKNIKSSLEERFKQLKWLSKEFSLQSINYRYDPIIFYKKKGSSNILNNLKKFKLIIENVSNIGVREIIFSFATIYSKVKNRMDSRGYIPIDPSGDKKREVLNELMKICEKNNLQMKACCQPDLLGFNRIEQAHCIDANIIEQLIEEKIPKIRDTGQRKDCGCFKSKDIGGYSGIFRCKHNCDYCYASPAKR
jgi:DNA repair photolyase